MIVAFPHPPGSGGPGSFQLRIEESLSNSGWRIIYPDISIVPDLIFVVGGTKKIGWLWKMRLRGVPILYRLDGINWVHRIVRKSWKIFFLAEFRNFNNKIIHAFLADHIIYQSKFVKNWWERSSFRQRNECSIIHNGVDLNRFVPTEEKGELKIVCLEGTIDYSPYSLRLINELREKLPLKFPIELYGRFERVELKNNLHPEVRFHGLIPREKVAKALKGSIYLSLDIHPACPNGVIEALASGSPVVAFDTGSLKELVPSKAGIVVPYGSDPWELGYPDIDALIDAIEKVVRQYSIYSKNARKVAEEKYDLDNVTHQYISVINKLLGKKQKIT